MRILSKMHTVLDVTKTGPVWDLTPIPVSGSNSNWKRATGTQDLFVSESFFDLSGLAQDMETVFPTNATVQRGSFPAVGNAVAGDSYQVLDVLTSIPVDLDTLTSQIDWLYAGPGMLSTTLNFEHVIYARRQRWTADLDTNSAFMMKADEAQFGSLSPTASDRVYSYRVVWINETPGSPMDRLYTSSTRHVLQVEAAEEPTYQYMMRLKRSYDLQQTPDRD